MWFWLGLLLLVLPLSNAVADKLDDGWAACQARREIRALQGRVMPGPYQEAVRADCNRIADKIRARPQPAVLGQNEVDAATAAAIAAALK